MIPIVAPKRLWPNSSSVSLTALNRKANRIFLWARISRLNSCGKGKHQMEIPHRQKLTGLFVQPLGFGQRLAFRTVAVTAGVISRVLKAASVALFEMTSQLLGATDLNGPHDLSVRG